MITYETSKQVYTDVCSECETPFATLKTRRFLVWLVRELSIISLLTILFIPLLSISLAIGWTAIPLWGLYFWVRTKQQSKCPSCRHFKLVPVASPKGLEIMKKQGWEPLEQNSF